MGLNFGTFVGKNSLVVLFADASVMHGPMPGRMISRCFLWLWEKSHLQNFFQNLFGQLSNTCRKALTVF